MDIPSPLPAKALRAAVGERYGQVATQPEEPSRFLVGRAFAEAVGYPPDLLDRFRNARTNHPFTEVLVFRAEKCSGTGSWN